MMESDYKMRLVKQVKEMPRGYARRVEDKYRVGALDLLIKLPDQPFLFAEGKMLVEGYLFEPTERQFEEGEAIIRADLQALLIGWKKGTMYVSPWVRKADIRECFTCAGNYAEVLIGYLNAAE